MSTIKKYPEGTVISSLVPNIHNEISKLVITDKKERKKVNQKHISSVKNEIKNKKQLSKNNVCPKCGGVLIDRKGKYGKFKGCLNYPKCRYTA